MEAAYGLCMLAATADDVETTRKRTLAFSGRMRVVMTDAWKRLKAACAQHEQRCVAVAERNHELAKCGFPPTYRTPRPPLMAVGIQVDCGDAYIMHTDTIEGDNDEDMIRYELECRGEYGLTESLPDTAVPIRIDRYHVGEVVRQNARREHAVNLAYSL